MKSEQLTAVRRSPALTAAKAFAKDVAAGLGGPCKSLPSVYLYDKTGSYLFSRITELEEYYLTACEFEILQKAQAQIARFMEKTPFSLIEFGAGDGRKTAVLIEHFLTKKLKFEYAPIDISEEAMRELDSRIKGNLLFDGLKMREVIGDYFGGLRRAASRGPSRKLVLLLGSTIGNFSQDKALALLRRLRAALKPGDFVLVGFDLKKDVAVMERAYNDSQGVTARFNLNVLRRINAELNANFNLDAFSFQSGYDGSSGAIESWLVSKKNQSVSVEALQMSFSFKKGEKIHTESSYKFSNAQISRLAGDCGFSVASQWYDSRNYFADSLWSTNKLPGRAIRQAPVSGARWIIA